MGGASHQCVLGDLAFARWKCEDHAGFADATYDVTNRLRLTAGIRYTDDRKSREGVAARYGLALGTHHIAGVPRPTLTSAGIKVWNSDDTTPLAVMAKGKTLAPSRRH